MVFRNLLSAVSQVAIGVIAAKGFALVSFYTAVSILMPEQIGAYSYVFGALGFLLCYQSGSVGPLLIERGIFVSGDMRPYISYAWISNLIMVGVAGVYFAFMPDKTMAIALIAIMMMLNGMASMGQTFYRAKLVSNLNFRMAAIMDSGLAATQCAAFVTALLILRNESAYAFSFLGLFLCNLGLLFYQGHFEWPNLEEAKNVFRDAKYLVATSIFSQGTFFLPIAIVSRSSDAHTAGQFYFASQFVLSLGVLAQKPLQSAILPLTKDLQRTSSTGTREMASALFYANLLLCLAALFLSFVLDGIIETVWPDKWDGAASIAHLAVVAVTVKLITASKLGLLESEARWSLRGSLSLLEFLAVITLSVLGTSGVNSLQQIGAILFLGHALVNLVVQLIIARSLNIPEFRGLAVQIVFICLVLFYA